MRVLAWSSRALSYLAVAGLLSVLLTSIPADSALLATDAAVPLSAFAGALACPPPA